MFFFYYCNWPENSHQHVYSMHHANKEWLIFPSTTFIPGNTSIRVAVQNTRTNWSTRQLLIEAGWSDAPLALWNLAEAIHHWENCVNQDLEILNPIDYVQKISKWKLEPICFQGSALPSIENIGKEQNNWTHYQMKALTTLPVMRHSHLRCSMMGEVSFQT